LDGVAVPVRRLNARGPARDQFDLDAGAQGQRRDAHGGARGERCGEGLAVRRIHRREVGHVDQVHIALDHVAEAQARLREHRGQVGEALSRLGAGIAFDQGTGRGVDRGLAREVQQLSRPDSVRVGAYRGGARIVHGISGHGGSGYWIPFWGGRSMVRQCRPREVAACPR
jgi:hypothetical protein